MRRVLTTMKSSVRSKLVLRAVLLSAACALALAPAWAGQEAGQERKLFSSLLGGAVTFTTPEAWQNPTQQGTSMVGLLQMTALYPVEEGKEPGEERKVVARISLSAFNEDDTRSLKERSDPYYLTSNSREAREANFVMLSDTFHGGEWRTLAWKTTVRGELRLGLTRVGLVGKKWVGLSVMLTGDVDEPKPLKRAIADFNAMCESLKIDGKNQLDTKLNAKKILELLGAGEKK